MVFAMLAAFFSSRRHLAAKERMDTPRENRGQRHGCGQHQQRELADDRQARR
ncbi:MAG: hypothetical protein IPI73_27790 [Betaproteobacteria bacterium]|nr:hypothetical protein [Betaproteobacteria bacterium]